MAGGSVGRIWVTADVNMKQFEAKLKRMEDLSRETSSRIDRTVGGGGGSSSASASGAAAADALNKTGAAASRALRPTTALNYSMLRLSQAFVNLRYNNPLGVIAGLGQAASSAMRGISGLTGGMKGGGAAGMLLSGALTAVSAAAVAAGVAVLGTAAAVGMMAKNGLDAAADMEMLKIQYEGMLGSAKEAQAEVNFLMELGSESVVPTETILEANRQLLAFGITATDLRRNLVTFMSDYGSAAGLTTGQVQNLGYVIGQINAQGKALTQDIRQLANASIGIDKLAASIGVSTAEFQKMVSEGKATADVILPAILKIGEGSKDAAEKARNSARGILNNLKDITRVNMAKAFEDLLEKIKPVLRWVETFVSAFDFSFIAKSIDQVGKYFTALFKGAKAGAFATSKNISHFIGQTINVVGYAISKLIEYWMALYNTVRVIWEAISSGVQHAMGFVVDKVATVIGWAATVGEAFGQSWGDSLRQTEQSALNWASTTTDAAFAAGNAMVESANAAAGAWSNVFNFSGFKWIEPTLTVVSKGLDPATTTGGLTPTPDADGKGKGGKDDPRFAKWKEWLESLKDLIADFKEARYDLIRLQSGLFGTEGELSKAMKFGDAADEWQADVDSIIGGYEQAADAVRRYYDAMGGGEDKLFGAKVAKKAAAQRKAALANLQADTQRLVTLAQENQRLQTELAKWREGETGRLQKQLDATERTYQGFIGADGYFVKGMIQKANEALDAATAAYEAANDKLQELIQERNTFLSGIRDSARSFVNALSTASTVVQEFRRLDDIGSFVLTEKKGTESLKAQMKERLETLKEWAKNLQALRDKGLSADLIKDLMAAGPEAAGAAVADLANSGQDSIDEVNAIQSELASVIGSVQGQANDMFFSSAIAAQQSIVNGLAAQKAAAEAAALAAEAEYQKTRMALEAQMAEVEAGTDEHSRLLKQQMETNAIEAANITAAITAALKKITDKDNPFNPKKVGKSVIDGLIKGLEAKEPALIRKAQAIADAVSKTIAKALQINSPSKLMMQYGAWVGEGLAIGMDSSMSQIEAASFRMAGVTVPDLGADGASTPVVKVFIGDQELRDIVDVQVTEASARDLDTVLSGRRI